MTNRLDKEVVFQEMMDWLGRAEKWGPDLLACTTPSWRVPYTALPRDIRHELILHPAAFIQAAQGAIDSYLESKEVKTFPVFRPYSLPIDNGRLPRALRAEDIGKLRTVQGIVVRVSDVQPRYLITVYRCGTCHFEQEIRQQGFTLQEPLSCDKDLGGCGKRVGSTVFRLIPELSVSVDHQRVEMQDIPEMVSGGEQPQRRTCILERDLCSFLKPGDRVSITGIILVKPTKGKATAIYDTYIEAVDIGQALTMIETPLSSEEVTSFEAFAQAHEKDVLTSLTEMVAPSLFGMREVKAACLLSLVGGRRVVKRDGTIRRGEVHTLIVGDPGTGKSALVSYMQHIHPRAIYASGKGSSGVGMTAAVTKDEGDQYAVEGGVVVLADGGLAILDELDKVQKDDLSNLHECMELGRITLHKANIHIQLRAQTTILACANPKTGVFLQGAPIVTQINLPPPLISRFGLIFSILDAPQGDRDFALAMHNLTSVYGAEGQGEDREGPKWLKGYIRHARSFDPQMSPEVRKYMADVYRSIRSPKTLYYDESRSMTTRQLEDLQRLSEASARIRLSCTITHEDVDVATALLQLSLKTITAGEDGRVDVITTMTGATRTERGRLSTMIDILTMHQAQDRPILVKELYAEAEQQGISEHDAMKLLSKLSDQGMVTFPTYNEVILIRG